MSNGSSGPLHPEFPSVYAPSGDADGAIQWVSYSILSSVLLDFFIDQCPRLLASPTSEKLAVIIRISTNLSVSAWRKIITPYIAAYKNGGPVSISAAVSYFRSNPQS